MIDLTTRSKEETEVLSYNCLTVPDLNIALIGSYADGCIPRYEVKQTSMILLLDTEICMDNEQNDTDLIIGIIAGIVALLIVIGVILVIISSNENIRTSLFSKG